MLGKQVEDTITGLKGIATAKLEYINGCVRYCVQPPAKDGVIPTGEYIDAQQLIVLDNGPDVDKKDTGGPGRNTPADSYRR